MVEQEIILRRKLDLLLRTGKILVESAADTNRIVRNMQRVAAYLGLPEENLHIDVTYTMLVVNLSDESHSYSKFQKCEKHGINMTAISEISKGLPAAVSVSCSAATGSLSYSPLSPLLRVFVFARVSWSSASIYI